MTPPPSVGTLRPRADISCGVSHAYPCVSPHMGALATGATISWTWLVVDDSRRLLDVVCEAWPHWRTALAMAGVFGQTSHPAIEVQGCDDIYLVFTATIVGPAR